MTKQEKIKEELAKIEVGNVFDMDGNRVASLTTVGDEGADKILSYLHSQGVVIKVAGPNLAPCAFHVAFESLIEVKE